MQYLTPEQQSTLAKVKLPEDWKTALAEALTSDNMNHIRAFLREQYDANKVIYPAGSLMFNAFNLTPLSQVKVVILGQDPYHGAGQAMGLSFSVPKIVPKPPSLQNILRELASDLGIAPSRHGDLTHWAEQGVLLLNSMLSVEAGQAGSHQKIGWEVFTDAVIDCIKMLPFLFLAFLLIEALEHYSSDFTKKLMIKVDKAGPVVGAVVGCVPQCGFSVMAANLYSGGIITIGTLIAVFLATSDEAILIIMGNPEHAGKIGILLLAKVIIAIVAGYLVDIFFKKEIAVPHHEGELCHDCGCHNHSSGIVKPALRHTGKIFLYLFAFTFILNLCIEVLGIDRISAMMLGDTVFQPVIAALIGLLPNCAASVILTQLYLSGAISFASVIAGLCTGAGIGLVVLFKVNPDKKENVKIIAVLYGIAVAAGLILEMFGV